MMGHLEKAHGRELDPLLKDLHEKKQSFKRMACDVVSLAAELKEVRGRMAYQEESFAREAKTRQIAETKARNMERDFFQLQKSLEERDEQLQASTSSAEKYLKELENLRSQLSETQATADASTATAEAAQLQCLTLLKELDNKNNSLKEHEDRVNKLGEQLDHLQKEVQEREVSQKQLKDEVFRIEQEIKHAVAKSGDAKDSELMKILNEVSPKNLQNISKHLNAKDDEIARLRDEIRILSAHWKLKTQELESQLEKQQRADQELKKRVLKLEFCLQEARSHARKLQRMGEKRDKALKELKERLGARQQKAIDGTDKQNFWESSGFKIVASMTMVVLVVFAKR